MNSRPRKEQDNLFLHTLRKALVPDVEEPRTRENFPHIFQSAGDEYLMQSVHNRSTAERTALVATFQENGLPLSLGVHIVSTLAEAAELIRTIACDSSPEFGREKHLIQHAHPDIQQLQLWKVFGSEAISVHTAFSADPELREKTMASFIGITTADWGIAESATLVQCTAPGRPRSTSLVPSIHIGLLRKTNMLANLTEAYGLLRQNSMTESVTFISGPSKTADIEAHMVHGAHGPREMHVIILNDCQSETDG